MLYTYAYLYGFLHRGDVQRETTLARAAGAEIQPGFAAYRTTVSIRMSPLLICPQLAVNCVGEKERKKERKKERMISGPPPISLLPARWLRTGAGFSPLREYERRLLLSSTAAA